MELRFLEMQSGGAIFPRFEHHSPVTDGSSVARWWSRREGWKMKQVGYEVDERHFFL